MEGHAMRSTTPATMLLVVAFQCISGATPAAAQTQLATIDDVQRQLARGDTISVVTDTGEPVVGWLERFGSVDLDVRVGNTVPARRVGNMRIVTIPVDRIQSLERRPDSVRNGTAIGALVGAAFVGTMFAYAVAVDRNEMDEWAPIYAKAAVLFTGVGALAGWAVDRSHSKPGLIFNRAAATRTIAIGPTFSRGPGLALQLSF